MSANKDNTNNNNNNNTPNVEVDDNDDDDDDDIESFTNGGVIDEGEKKRKRKKEKKKEKAKRKKREKKVKRKKKKARRKKKKREREKKKKKKQEQDENSVIEEKGESKTSESGGTTGTRKRGKRGDNSDIRNEKLDNYFEIVTSAFRNCSNSVYVEKYVKDFVKAYPNIRELGYSVFTMNIKTKLKRFYSEGPQHFLKTIGDNFRFEYPKTKLSKPVILVMMYILYDCMVQAQTKLHVMKRNSFDDKPTKWKVSSKDIEAIYSTNEGKKSKPPMIMTETNDAKVYRTSEFEIRLPKSLNCLKV